jgi:outer membrane protein assembly factor BamB
MKKTAFAAAIAVFVSAFLPPGLAAQARVLWTFPGPSNPGYEWVTLAAADNNLAYAVKPGPSWDYSTESGKFTEAGSTISALDLASGGLVWSAESRWPILSPLLLTAGRLIAYNGYGEILCFSARDGKPLWKVEPELHPGGWDERTLPTAQGESIFLREGSEIVCRSLRDGKAAWRTPIESVQNRRVFLAPAGDRLIVANAMDAVLALDMKSGKVLWRKTIVGVGELVQAGPGFALVANNDRVFNLDPADGREIWTCGRPPMKFEFDARKMNRQDPRQLHEPIWNLENVKPLAVKGENVYFFQKRVMYPAGSPFMPELACYDLASGREMRWSQALGSEFQGLSLAGPVILTVEGRKVIAWNTTDGRNAWEFEIPGERLLQGQALAIGGKIMVVGSRGLTCLETGDPRLTGWGQCGGPARTGSVR